MSELFTVPPRQEWTRLTGDELLTYLKLNKLTPKKSEEPSPLFHRDALTHEFSPCTVVGYIDAICTVIEIEGKLDCISPEFLKEMQTEYNRLHPHPKKSEKKEVPVEDESQSVITLEENNGAL